MNLGIEIYDHIVILTDESGFLEIKVLRKLPNCLVELREPLPLNDEHVDPNFIHDCIMAKKVKLYYHWDVIELIFNNELYDVDNVALNLRVLHIFVGNSTFLPYEEFLNFPSGFDLSKYSITGNGFPIIYKRNYDIKLIRNKITEVKMVEINYDSGYIHIVHAERYKLYKVNGDNLNVVAHVLTIPMRYIPLLDSLDLSDAIIYCNSFDEDMDYSKFNSVVHVDREQFIHNPNMSKAILTDVNYLELIENKHRLTNVEYVIVYNKGIMKTIRRLLESRFFKPKQRIKKIKELVKKEFHLYDVNKGIYFHHINVLKHFPKLCFDLIILSYKLC